MEKTFSQEAIGQGDAKSTSQGQKDEDGCEHKRPVDQFLFFAFDGFQQLLNMGGGRFQVLC